MALDGITVAYIVHELKEVLLGGRIEKIQQPEKDEIRLIIKNKGKNTKLLLSANAQSPRIHITETLKDNPMKAPLFCMVLRKHLLNGRITYISQPGFERLINIGIEAINEMGDLAEKRLIIEIMGKHSNIILVGGNTVLDSAKHISHDTSSVREVLPGKEYMSPPGQSKREPDVDYETFKSVILGNSTQIQKLIYTSFTGISPISASEISIRAGIDPSTPAISASEGEIEKLYNSFKKIINDSKEGLFNGELILNEKGKPIEFSPFEMSLYSGEKTKYESISKLLEDFYTERDTGFRINQKSQDLRKIISVNIERCVKKHDIQQRTLREIENRDRDRLYGELITANLYRISQGDKSVTVCNYYDSDNSEITIPLDSELSPVDNSQKYYKKYNKAKRTFEALKTQIEQNKQELSYLESVMSAVENITDDADLQEIREELMEQGFVRRRKAKKGEKAKKASPLSFTSSDGFQIYVGKNNKQNDELTLRTATAEDIWLHTKDIQGSHVIIKTFGKKVPDRTLEEAANLAAFHSKARNGSLVPVDYTFKKHVKKPSGAKPGMVIYDNQKTVYITPNETLIKNLSP